MFTVFERVIIKSNARKEMTGEEPKYLVISKPVATELLHYMSDKKVSGFPVTMELLDGATFTGLKVVILNTNKYIFEVG